MRAVVTGGERALAQAVARYLGDCGYDVAIQYTGDADITALLTDKCTKGRAAVAIPAVLADPVAMADLIPQAAAKLGGPVTCVVHAASGADATLALPGILRGLAAQLDAPQTDDTGELRAPGTVVLLIDQPLRGAACGSVAADMIRPSVGVLTQSAALQMAPLARVNAIGLRAGFEENVVCGQADILATLRYLIDSPAVTGQVFCLDVFSGVKHAPIQK